MAGQLTLANGTIFVGNGSNIAVGVSMSGDISISNAGLTAYAGVVPIAKGGSNNASLSVTQGNVYYGDGTKLVALSPGTSGFFLKTQGASANPIWAAVTAGDFSGPAVSVDNTIVRFDGTTGKLGQASSVVIGDNGDITTSVTGASVGLTVSNGSQTTGIALFKDGSSSAHAWNDFGLQVISLDNYTGNTDGIVLNCTVPSSPSGTFATGMKFNVGGSLNDGSTGTLSAIYMAGSNTGATANGRRSYINTASTGALTGTATSATFAHFLGDLNNGAFPTTPSAYNGQGIWYISALNRSSTSTAAKGSGGIGMRVYAGNTLIGVSGMADQGNGSNAKVVGVRGTASTDTTDFSGSYAGSAGVIAVTSPTSNSTLHDYLPSVKCALLAENLASTEAIIIGLDNGVTCFQVADGGIITLGAASTTPKHVLNTATYTAGTDAMTMLNGPAGTAGNPDTFIRINIGGVDHTWPAWIPT